MKNGQILVGHWKQVPIFFHWSVAIWFPWYFFQMQRVVPALMASLATLLILVAHECGHALMARLRTTPVYAVRIYFLQGRCEHAHPHDEMDDVCIAWGGVLAQGLLLGLALLLQRLLLVTWPEAHFFLDPAFNTLIFANLLWMAFTLLPIAPLDGHVAWRIIPLLRGTRLRFKSELRRTVKETANEVVKEPAKVAPFPPSHPSPPPSPAQPSADTVTYELLKRLRQHRPAPPPAPDDADDPSGGRH